MTATQPKNSIVVKILYMDNDGYEHEESYLLELWKLKGEKDMWSSIEGHTFLNLKAWPWNICTRETIPEILERINALKNDRNTDNNPDSDTIPL